MDLLNSSLVLYLMVGVGVGVAAYLAGRADARTARTFRIVTAVLFWPLYVPVLLQTPRPHSLADEMAPIDEMAAVINQVDGELQTALGSLRGWAEGVLTREKDRLGELRSAWIAQAKRIREMDYLLSRFEPTCRPTNENINPRLQQSEHARHRNLHRIQQLRARAHEDLMNTLAWVRELVSMIHLAKFTGAPASRAEEIVAQIAAAVEGLSAVSWQEERTVDEDNPAMSLAESDRGLNGPA